MEELKIYVGGLTLKIIEGERAKWELNFLLPPVIYLFFCLIEKKRNRKIEIFSKMNFPNFLRFETYYIIIRCDFDPSTKKC